VRATLALADALFEETSLAIVACKPERLAESFARRVQPSSS
jgi:hypothetical protein